MAGKIHEFMIKINGMLDSSVTKSLSNLKNAMNKLEGSRNINQVSKHAAAYKILRDASEKAAVQMSQSRKAVSDLSRQMEGNRKIAEAISKQYQASKAQSDAIKVQRDQAKAQKSTLQTQLKALQDAGISKQSEGYQRLQAQIRATNDQIRNLGQAYTNANAQTRQFAQANRLASRELEQMQSNLQRNQSTLNRLQNEQRSRSQQMSEHQRAMRDSGYSGNFESQSGRIERERARRENYENARSRMSARYQKVQDSYSNFQQAQDLATSMMSPFTNALEVAADFEASTSRVQAIMQGGSSEQVDMSRIVAEAKRLGAETNFKASEAMDAAYYAAIAGWKEDQILAAMPSVLNLANAGGVGIAKAMDVISDEMTAFGLDTKNSEVIKKYTDQFAFTITNANTDVEQLHEAMKYAAPAMHAAGVSAEQSFSIAAMMANAGIKGSSSGTAMRKWALNTIDPRQVSEDLLNAEGMTMSDLTKQQLEAKQALSELFSEEQIETFYDSERGMINMLEAFAKAGEGKSNAERADMLRPLTGLTAFSGMEAVIEAAMEGEFGEASALETFFQGIMTQEDTAGKISKIMTDNLQGDRKILESAIESVQLNIGEAILPSMRNLLQTVTPIVAGFSEWAKENSAVIQLLAKVAASITAVVVAGAGIALMGNLFAFAGSGISMLLAGAKMLPVVMSLAGAQLRMIPVMLQAANAQMMTLLRTTMAMASGGIQSLIAGFRAIPLAVSGAMAGIRALPMYIATLGASLRSMATLEGLKSLAMGARAMAASFLSASLSMLPILLGVGLLALAGYAIYENWSTLSGVFGEVGNSIGVAFDGALAKVSVAIEAIKVAFSSIDGNNLTVMVNMMTSGIAGAITLIGGLIATLVTTLGNVAVLIVNIFGTIGAVVGNLLEGNISGAWNALIEGMKASASAFIETIKGLFGGIWDSVSGAFGTMSHIYNTIQGNTSGTADFRRLNDTSTQAPIDATAVENLNVAAESSATNMQVLDQAAQNTATTSLPQIDAATQVTSQNLTEFGASAQNASGCFDGINASATNAAQSLDQIPAAVSSAVSGINSAAASANIPTTAGIPVAHNAIGGIYSQGSFLTTFAENSAEAAIPLDGSQRAKSLWVQAGEILGMLPNGDVSSGNFSATGGSFGSPSFNLTINVSGNADQNTLDQITTSMRESFEEMWRSFTYEKERVSFA